MNFTWTLVASKLPGICFCLTEMLTLSWADPPPSGSSSSVGTIVLIAVTVPGMAD